MRSRRRTNAVQVRVSGSELPPHARAVEDVLRSLYTSARGLRTAVVAERLRRFGPNVLPRGRPPSLAVVFLRQFLSPLIYVLLAAAAVSVAIGHASDAGFILAVLLLNAVIGAAQEHAAQRSAEALQALVAPRARVVRDGADRDVDAASLVPGDVVRLEAGVRVPADARVISCVGLEADESLLTGESFAVAKRADPPVRAEAPVADRVTMLFAGSIVTRGRATAVVVATGSATELGTIASAVLGAPPPKPPLLVRMDALSRRIALAVAAVALLLGAVSLARGIPAGDVFLSVVALAVSAIPEGLPVALTVALSIGARRMARRKVIARRLVAVETLGSCTYVASDKTGTLTLNELTVRAVLLPGERPWEVTGAGLEPTGRVVQPPGIDPAPRLAALATAGALVNDAFFGELDAPGAVHVRDALTLSVSTARRGCSRAAARFDMAQPSAHGSPPPDTSPPSGSPMLAGPAAGIAGGLVMAAALVFSGAISEFGPLAAIEPMGATFADPARFEGGGRAVALGIVIHLGVSAFVGLIFAAVLPHDFPPKEAGVMCIGFGFVVMSIMTSAVVPAVNPLLKAHFHDLGGSWVVAHALFGFSTGYTCQQFRRGLLARTGRQPKRASA